jgi:hypothetical protein
MAMSLISRKLLLPMLFVVSGSVWAEDSSLLVGLHIQSVRLDLKYAASVRKTDLSRLDLVWSQPLNSWLDGSVKLGILELTQSSNPIPAGQSTSGNALGLGMRFHLHHGDRLKLHADIGYQYADTTADVSGQQVDTRWHQVSGYLQADIRIVQYSYVSLALGAITIHGDENATGTVTASQSFQSKTPGFGRLGILIGVDPTSHVGIEVSSGAITGGRIYFQRWF